MSEEWFKANNITAENMISEANRYNSLENIENGILRQIFDEAKIGKYHTFYEFINLSDSIYEQLMSRLRKKGFDVKIYSNKTGYYTNDEGNSYKETVIALKISWNPQQ